MHIMVCLPLNEAQKSRLRHIAGADQIHFRDIPRAGAPLHKAFCECEVVLGNVPADWLTSTSKLRWMQLESVGYGEYEHLDWTVLGRQITVTNLAGFFTEAVAETALAGILALYRGIYELAHLQKARDWQEDRVRSDLHLLEEARVLVAGHGSIGRRFAALLEPFSCSITRYDVPGCDGADICSVEELEAALPSTDVLMIALPEAAQTRSLFNAERFDLLKPGSIVVNMGRGSVVDEQALVENLRSGHLGGAVIDVTVKEPLAVDHPLWECPNLILTQHSAGGTADELDRKITIFEEQLRCYRNGQDVDNVVLGQTGD